MLRVAYEEPADSRVENSVHIGPFFAGPNAGRQRILEAWIDLLG
jgi:hypothetical protein